MPCFYRSIEKFIFYISRELGEIYSNLNVFNMFIALITVVGVSVVQVACFACEHTDTRKLQERGYNEHEAGKDPDVDCLDVADRWERVEHESGLGCHSYNQ